MCTHPCAHGTHTHKTEYILEQNQEDLNYRISKTEKPFPTEDRAQRGEGSASPLCAGNEEGGLGLWQLL